MPHSSTARLLSNIGKEKFDCCPRLFVLPATAADNQKACAEAFHPHARLNPDRIALRAAGALPPMIGWAAASGDAMLDGKTGLMSALVKGCYELVPIPEAKLGSRKLDIATMYNAERYRPMYANNRSFCKARHRADGSRCWASCS